MSSYILDGDLDVRGDLTQNGQPFLGVTGIQGVTGVVGAQGNTGVGITGLKGADSYSSEYDAGNSGSSLAIDWADGANQKVTLTASCTFTFNNATNGQTYLLKLIQGGSGSYTISLPGSVAWPANTPPTLSTAVGKIDIVTLYFDGANYFGNFVLGYQV